MSDVNRAWYFPETGSPDRLTETELPVPQPGKGELLIRVLASGFNPIDTKIRAGLAPIAADNHVPGCDVCGEFAANSWKRTYLPTSVWPRPLLSS